ncbi:MAG: tRNA (adenosine(37)-N6)-dimethylallyltransferase MiaA [Eubacteriales bacterium]|nr:tRNA (adenosine(37)-N6)-dimethylallyltransferase MiaA [Eubacteriales bacterium]
MKEKLLVLCGPTATGKTALGVRLAQALNGEIVSADSMQLYRDMDVGTAKPDAAERGGIAHHMLDVADPGQPFNVAQYQRQAAGAIADIAARGKLPILCGGTGLYINALLYGHDQGDTAPDAAFRAEMAGYLAQNGPEALHLLLQQRDAATAARLHPNNAKRVIRALEILRGGGVVPDGESPQKACYQACIVGLTMQRELLYRRIDARVDDMMRRGLTDEVKKLRERLTPASTALQAIGYKELIAFLQRECSLDEAVARIKQQSRHYAKRQMTWFRRMPDIRWYQVDDYASADALAQDVCVYAKDRLELN